MSADPVSAPLTPTRPERPRLRALWWTLGAFLLALISALSLMPLHGPVIDLPSSDKLLHGCAYVALTLYFAQLVGRGRAGLVRVVSGLIAYGIGIELLQSMLPPRSAEFADLAANAGGIVIGLALLSTPLGRVLRALERALAPTSRAS